LDGEIVGLLARAEVVRLVWWGTLKAEEWAVLFQVRAFSLVMVLVH